MKSSQEKATNFGSLTIFDGALRLRFTVFFILK